MAAAADTVPPRPALQPSNSIRISLHERQSSLSSYQTTCISKHYALNNQILAAFESNFKNELWEVAYQFGLKFLETSLLEIPKHGYFYSDKFSTFRLQSTIDALRVCHQLQEIIAKQPKDFAKECRRIDLFYYLASEQYERLPVYEEVRKKTERELTKAYPKEASSSGHRRGDSSSSSFTASLLACGDTFSAVFCPQNTTSVDEYKTAFPDETSAIAEDAKRQALYPPTSSEARQPDESLKMSSSSSTRHTYTRESSDAFGIKSNSSLLDDDDEEEEEAGVGVASTTPREHPRPAKRKMSKLSPEVAIGIALDTPDPTGPPVQHARTQSDYDLQRALFLSGLQVDLPNNAGTTNFSMRDLDSISERGPFAPPGAKKREVAGSGLSIDMLSGCFHEDFDTLKKRGRISIHQLPTYQGRNPGSINGCTVIAPLLCIHHFANGSSAPDTGIPDQTIVQVIDDETPSILPVVRQNLGLVKDAFLIPVDAHDSLMEQNYMCQEQFLTVCGGNILEQEHLQALLDHLSTSGPKKLAASLFFHEHVITILQLRRSDQSVWFDVIDSLPHEETFIPAGETSTAESSSAMALSRRASDAAIGAGSNESLRFESEGTLNGGGFSEEFLVDQVPPTHAVRIRCMDIESLKATILWYACSVFTPGNRAYIDTYEWDEKLSDFDPRVFQAFIWTEA